MAAGGIKLKDMSEEERRAYYREASRRWRERNPDYWKKVGKPRREARIAAETPEEREARRAKEYAYEQATSERRNALRRERHDKDPEKRNGYHRDYRKKNLERVRETEKASVKRNYAKRKSYARAFRNKRRALLRGAASTETIKLEVLAERDNWRCHLCGKKVTRANWSMDHLIPVSRGGEHTYQNVALAHRICNCRRSDRYAPAQLRLIG